METFNINPVLAVIAILLIFFGGVVVGHQYGLIREKQREFNAVAGAVRDAFINRYNPALSQYPEFSAEEIELIFSVMSPFHRHVFHKNYTAYLDSINANSVKPIDGRLQSSNPHLIEKHFQKLVSHLQNK